MSVSGIYTADGQYNTTGGGGQSSGPVVVNPTTQGAQATNTATNVPASTTSGTLLAANTNRGQFNIVNDGTAVLYLLFGTGVGGSTTTSNTNYTFALTAGQTLTENRWKGSVQGVWSAANGNARVSEWTA